MLYTIKKFTYRQVRNPRIKVGQPGGMVLVRECITVAPGLTWKEAKEMRKADRSLIIFEGSTGPTDGEQVLNSDDSTVAQKQSI